MLQTKHFRKISKTAFTPSAPCERTFCMQKTLKTLQAFSVFVYVLRSSIKRLCHILTAAADSKSLSCSTAYLSERR